MKTLTIYQCEICGKKSEDKSEIMNCEAAHSNLSITDMQEWKRLKEQVKSAGYTVSVTKNEQTDKLFDEATENLLNFEKKHGL